MYMCVGYRNRFLRSIMNVIPHHPKTNTAECPERYVLNPHIGAFHRTFQVQEWIYRSALSANRVTILTTY